MVYPYCTANIVYMRFYQGKDVLRVARVAGGECTALYPTSDKSRFEAEIFRETDDPSASVKVERKTVKDKVWLRLLDGEPIPKILARFEECGHFHVNRSVKSRYDPSKVLDLPTFRIAEDAQEKTNRAAV